MRLVFGSDHAAYEMRKALEDFARAEGHEVASVGATSGESYDYPDASDAVVAALRAGEADLGVLLCGTGIGVSIRANRYPGIRAALCCGPEMARLAREHNDANILCMGGRTNSLEQAAAMLQSYLSSEPDLNERHARRRAKLDGNISVPPTV